MHSCRLSTFHACRIELSQNVEPIGSFEIPGARAGLFDIPVSRKRGALIIKLGVPV
jgi:hypothetical protein